MIDKIKPETINNLLTEDASLRKANAKVYPLGSNKYHAAIHLGDIHYKDNYSDNLEQWKDIDLTWSGNRIDKAPYILVRDGNVFTVTDKRTGLQSLIELSAIGTTAITKAAATAAKTENLAPNVDFEVIPQNHQIRFQRTLKNALAAKDAKFKITGDLPIKYQAYDADGEPVELTTEIKDGILTETVKDKSGLKYPIKVDPTINLDVAASADDCDVYWNGSAWVISLTRALIRVGYNLAASSNCGSAMRFQNANIPSGVSIDTAYITFTASNSDSNNNVMSQIWGEKATSPAEFSTIADYQARCGVLVGGADNSKRTTAVVSYDAIAAWTKDTTYNSPELKTVVQEISDLGAVSHIALFWLDHAGVSTATDYTIRRAYSYDGDPAKAPVLHIEYTYFRSRLAYYFQNIMR